LAKASLLMAAGIVLYAIGSDKLSDMDGMARRLPVTTLAMALSCVTLIGLPPSGGFIAKWLLLTATIESGQWWWIPPLLGGGLLTAAYAFRLLSYAFRTEGRVPPMRPVPLGMEMMTLSLALVAILIGLRVQEPMRLIEPIAEPAGMGEEVGHE
jgi:formate hydrogenlyase subunit 3/multisubunit Na+/H+ antiporter MnhD subunit